MTSKEYMMLIKLIDLNTKRLHFNHNDFSIQIDEQGIMDLKRDIKECLLDEEEE